MSRTPLIGMLLLTAGDTTGRAQSSGDPDPAALLRGVEASRRDLFGRIKLRLTTTDHSPRVGGRSSELETDFDGVKRRAAWRYTIFVMDTIKGRDNGKALAAVGYDDKRAEQAGLGKFHNAYTTAVYDGERFINYTAEHLGNTVIQDPTKGSGIPCFDPRIVGLTEHHSVAYTFERCLGFHMGEKLSLVGREDMDGTPLWRVRSTHSSDTVRDYWVEDKDGFRVRKFTQINDTPEYGQRFTVRSEYGNLRQSPILPTRVTVESERKVGGAGYKPTATEVLEVVESDFTTRPDPSRLTVAGLGLPPGEMMIDEVNHKVVGYWDGTGFNPDAGAAKRLGQQAQRAADDAASAARTRRWAAILAGVALVVTGSVLVWRRLRPSRPVA